MTETNSTGTAELADARPAEGEYFYHEGITSDSGLNTRSACFVCGERTDSTWGCGYRHIRAIAQCLAAGRRIACMFKLGTCQGPEPNREGGARIVVSVCERHKRHAQVLCDLTKDGVITSGHVSQAETSAISRLEFNKLVAEGARAIWSYKEGNRKVENWYDALPRCIKELGHIPSPIQRTEMAIRLYEERKQAQAFEDWLEAEKKISALYAIDQSS